MEAFRLIVLCSVLAAAACQRRGQGSPHLLPRAAEEREQGTDHGGAAQVRKPGQV
ncbi:hypothetical protein FJT64_008488 [Amphibalanus amphitrite]|uniref:Uncharacterized protein n=1 Tax=Amphibalanus amphitrite TaxID=1232801 RepID=A0A6A4VSS7_AMPAM|nr:hypothetical protein FJT64_008488 [Amphibalanus amphitrite]